MIIRLHTGTTCEENQCDIGYFDVTPEQENEIAVAIEKYNKDVVLWELRELTGKSLNHPVFRDYYKDLDKLTKAVINDYWVDNYGCS